MTFEKISIKKIKQNFENPRLISDPAFKKLVRSIIDFPEMLDIRPIVINQKNIIIGGNMRFAAAKDAGLTEVPFLKVNLSPQKEKEFIIKDNVSGGSWDFDLLNQDWSIDELKEWGLEVPTFDLEDTHESIPVESSDFFLNIRCENESHAQNLYEKFISEGLDVKIVK